MRMSPTLMYMIWRDSGKDSRNDNNGGGSALFLILIIIFVICLVFASIKTAIEMGEPFAFLMALAIIGGLLHGLSKT